MSQEKKGIAAWLALSEETRASFIRWLRDVCPSERAQLDLVAADALEELSDSHKGLSIFLAAKLQSLVGQRNTAATRAEVADLLHSLASRAQESPPTAETFEFGETGLQRLVEKLGGREALQELLNFFGD